MYSCGTVCTYFEAFSPNIWKACFKEDSKENSASEQSGSESGSGDDRLRKRKIRQMKVKERKPVIPIAVGRSRRRVAKVDYNFEAYDEMIQDAVDEISEAPVKQKYTG